MKFCKEQEYSERRVRASSGGLKKKATGFSKSETSYLIQNGIKYSAVQPFHS